MQFKQLAKGFIGVMLLTIWRPAVLGIQVAAQKREQRKLVVQFVPTNNDGSMEAKQNHLLSIYRKVRS